MMKKFTLPIGAMINDVLRSFFSKPVTRQYPFERREAPERFRGKLVWDLTHCTGCKLCVRDCPAGALELVEIDKANKHFIMRFHSDRCTYCGQCVVNCRFNCLEQLPDEWELGSITKEPFTVYYGRSEEVDAVRNGAASNEE